MDATEALTIYGPLGVFVILFVLGLVVGKKEHDRVIAERDKATQQRDALLDDVFNKVAPLLERAAEAIKAREAHDSDVHSVLVDVRRLLERRSP